MTIDPAIVSLADHAGRDLLAEVRRGEIEPETLSEVPAMSLVLQIAAEARAAGIPLPVSILRVDDIARSAGTLSTARS